MSEHSREEVSKPWMDREASIMNGPAAAVDVAAMCEAESHNIDHDRSSRTLFDLSAFTLRTAAATIARLTAERDHETGRADLAEKERDEARAQLEAERARDRELRRDLERQLDEARERGDSYLAELKKR